MLFRDVYRLKLARPAQILSRHYRGYETRKPEFCKNHVRVFTCNALGLVSVFHFSSALFLKFNGYSYYGHHRRSKIKQNARQSYHPSTQTCREA